MIWNSASAQNAMAIMSIAASIYIHIRIYNRKLGGEYEEDKNYLHHGTKYKRQGDA